MILNHPRMTVSGKIWVLMVKWLDYSPFTSKVTSSNPSSVLGPSPHVKRAQVNALRKVVGFLRVLRFPPTGKVDRVG